MGTVGAGPCSLSGLGFVVDKAQALCGQHLLFRHDCDRDEWELTESRTCGPIDGVSQLIQVSNDSSVLDPGFSPCSRCLPRPESPVKREDST